MKKLLAVLVLLLTSCSTWSFKTAQAANVMEPFTWTFTIVADTTKPVISNMFPAPGAKNVPADSKISFDVTDTESGVDPRTIQVFVNGNPVDYSLTSIPDGYRVEVTGIKHPNNAVITVLVKASDLAQ